MYVRVRVRVRVRVGVVTLQVFYFTFVARMTSVEISKKIIEVPVVGLLIQVCFGIGWGKFFSNKDRHPVRTTPC
jgi:hypothetical protein